MNRIASRQSTNISTATPVRNAKPHRHNSTTRALKWACSVLLLLALPTGCLFRTTLPQKNMSLAQARRGFHTILRPQHTPRDPVEQAPASLFRTLNYPGPCGDMAAYLSPDPRDGKKHPAILWITGGDCNSIGDVWSPASADNDQTAAAYRKAGIIMMFLSLRGGNRNPGIKEGFLGEVEDILAATKFLAAQPYVDPARI